MLYRVTKNRPEKKDFSGFSLFNPHLWYNLKEWRVVDMSFLRIDAIKNLDIKVIKDNEVLYEGNVENAPQEIKEMSYKSIEQVSPMILQV